MSGYVLWRALETDGRYMLTTKDQPFVLIGSEYSDTFNEKLYSFGVSCFRGHRVFIHEDCELGVISRVFQNQRMEFTHNLFDYSSQEHPQQVDAVDALSYNIKSSVVIPCGSLGVIGIVSQLDFDPHFLSYLSSQDGVSEKTSLGSASTVQSERHATIKADYQTVTIKFQLSACSGIDGLSQQVSKRLDLEVGTYTAKYQDKQNDWILIACDEDVRDGISNSTSSDGTLKMLLEPVAK